MRIENRHYRQKKIAATRRWYERYYGGQIDDLRTGMYVYSHYVSTFWERFNPEKEIRILAITPRRCSGGDHGMFAQPRKQGLGDPHRDKRKAAYMFDKVNLKEYIFDET